MDGKPLVLNDNTSLVEKDLTNVYRHWMNPDSQKIHLQFDVKFKKKEDVNTLSKALLKHRILGLTGKNLVSIENELGKNLETVEELKRFSKLLILEAFEKLPKLPPMKAHEVEEPMDISIPRSGTKRQLDNLNGAEKEVEPLRKRGRQSIASATQVTPSRLRANRRSMAPELLRRVVPEPQMEEETVEEVKEEEEVEEEEEDFSDLGPNPTPQMIELKRKKLAAAKKSPKKKVAEPLKPKAISTMPKKKVVQAPPLVYFPGEKDSKVFFVEGDASKFSGKDFSKVPNTHLGSFPGVNFSFIHTPIEWEATDVLKMIQSIRAVNNVAGLDSYLVMVGCGISNVDMFRQAFNQFTQHVQLVVFDKSDMNLKNESNAVMLRETTALFLLGYFFPGCQSQENLPPSRMVRPDLTNCFRAKSNEDLENTIVHAFTEENDWIFDIFCGSRELSLAAQKSARNVVAFDKDRTKLEEIALKAVAISEHHDAKFRSEVDGKVLKV